MRPEVSVAHLAGIARGRDGGAPGCGRALVQLHAGKCIKSGQGLTRLMSSPSLGFPSEAMIGNHSGPRHPPPPGHEWRGAWGVRGAPGGCKSSSPPTQGPGLSEAEGSVGGARLAMGAVCVQLSLWSCTQFAVAGVGAIWFGGARFEGLESGFSGGLMPSVAARCRRAGGAVPAHGWGLRRRVRRRREGIGGVSGVGCCHSLVGRRGTWGRLSRTGVAPAGAALGPVNC